MKEFIHVLRRFVPPYKKYLVLSIIFNILSAILNIFSFATLIPLLQILFKVDAGTGAMRAMAWSEGSFKEVLSNNADYYTQIYITSWGPTTVLLVIGLLLAFMTFLKTGAYFLSSASITPIRTGVVRDIRNQLYEKITSLSLGFFSEERKGDIIARMSGDVQEVDNSIMSSIDMLFKNPVLIIIYFTTLLIISWQLTLFTLIFVPIFGWFMGFVGRKLKQNSMTAQKLWSDTMSQVEETLGGLRVIKAFCAEGMMKERFDKINSQYRSDIMRVNIRQQLAHPMSEFLGTVMIVVVLWFGGTLVLGESPIISGPTFIYYLVILYSIINPLKEFSRAGYNIPKGLASMERIDKILKAEVKIQDPEKPVHIDSFEHEIEFRNVSFAYTDGKDDEDYPELHWVLKNINLVIPKGKTVALVGQSGSGKSTLLDLIPRYYDVQEAAKIANAHEFILHSEHGYDTNIGDRGGRLSGGQRQRVSIARAILKNPPILILDEATSALDTESERLVQDALYKLMKTRTTIAVAHRLSTIKNSDEICVLHEGEIVERGTHDELMNIEGYYKKLHDMQEI